MSISDGVQVDKAMRRLERKGNFHVKLKVPANAHTTSLTQQKHLSLKIYHAIVIAFDDGSKHRDGSVKAPTIRIPVHIAARQRNGSFCPVAYAKPATEEECVQVAGCLEIPENQYADEASIAVVALDPQPAEVPHVTVTAVSASTSQVDYPYSVRQPQGAQ